MPAVIVMNAIAFRRCRRSDIFCQLRSKKTMIRRTRDMSPHIAWQLVAAWRVTTRCWLPVSWRTAVNCNCGLSLSRLMKFLTASAWRALRRSPRQSLIRLARRSGPAPRFLGDMLAITASQCLLSPSESLWGVAVFVAHFRCALACLASEG